MTFPTQINNYLDSQKSIQFYPKVRQALFEVFLRMDIKTFCSVTKNLYLMVLHETALGQVMHFPQPKGKFKILQLSVAKNVPLPVLRYVVAHELGHVMQGRNWKKADGQSLEVGADNLAKKWGFSKTKDIAKWMSKPAKKFFK